MSQKLTGKHLYDRLGDIRAMDYGCDQDAWEDLQESERRCWNKLADELA